ncbi:hypothetical protein KJ671_02550 [Patescibacteria group bacterium]|nr:hypothetical protein [Patescibacteria group bacterium]
MLSEKYIPSGPYIFKTGKRKGKSLEELMFENYSWLDYMLKNMNSNLKEFSKLNSFHLHLRWLMARGEDRVSTQSCFCCLSKRVEFFAYSYREKKYFTACEDVICRGKILAKANSRPLKFSSILEFSYPSRLFIAKFLREMFLPCCKKLTADELFKFFSAQNPPT